MEGLTKQLVDMGVDLVKIQNTKQYDVDDKINLKRYLYGAVLNKLRGQCGVPKKEVEGKKAPKPVKGTSSLVPAISCFWVKKA